MSNFNNASLIVTPNAYKAGKLYSLKPTDGAGDLNVVRATSATRVNEQGLIEIPRTNLLLRSEEFNVSPWGTLGTITITQNSTIAPDGNNTADLILGDNASSSISQIYSGSIGVVYTSSFFIKNNNSTQSQLLIRNASTVVDAALNWTGSVLSSITNTTGITTFQSYNNGWYRIMSTYTSVEAAQRPRILPTLSTNQSVYIWGAQLEEGVKATEYIPTTSVIRTRFAGITQDGGSASNIPRIDYTNGSCPSILVEPQRTNLVFPSATATTQTKTVTATAHTLSFYGTGSVVLSGVATGTLVGTGVNNRVTLTFTPTAGSLILTVVGSVTNWQLEAGANATSYIPTVASSVTRNADVISKTGISSLIGQTEGTIFCDVNLTFLNASLNRSIINLLVNDADVNNIVRLRVGGANFSYDIRNSGVVQSAINSIVPSIGRYKLAIIYKNNYAAFFINGVKIGQDLSVSIPSGLKIIRLGSFNSSGVESFHDYINSVLVLPIALTDQECIDLTTL